jgi:hypothetical protein
MIVASRAGGLGEGTMKRFKVKIITHVRATLFSFSKQSKLALISYYRPRLGGIAYSDTVTERAGSPDVNTWMLRLQYAW